MYQKIICLFMFCYNVFGYPSENGQGKFTLIDRATWKAAPSTDKRPITQPVPYVVIHHTYIPAACENTEDCSASMRSMQKSHMSNGWGDIGYNFCIGGDGFAYEGRGWDVVGIHAGPANSKSIGICLIGDWRTDIPPEKMLKTTKALISAGVAEGHLSPSYQLIGHNQTMATECPGSQLFSIISTWKHFVQNPDFVIKKRG